MHAFLFALLATGVAAFGSLPAAHPGNPCLDPEDFIATNSIDTPLYCVIPSPIGETKATCKAAGCDWDEEPDAGKDSCECNSEQLCESDAVGGTWTSISLTCGGPFMQAAANSWTCASNPNELDWYAGGCCRGGVASSKCNTLCETPDCEFNPCMDPDDFVPAATIPADHCVGDENDNPIAATKVTCEAAGCGWDEDDNTPCGCHSEQLCESPAVGGTWTLRSRTCGGRVYQEEESNPTCASNPNDPNEMDFYAGRCCSGGMASSKCA